MQNKLSFSMIRKIKTKDYLRLLDIWRSAVLNTHHFLKEEDYKYYETNIPNYFEFVSLFGYEEEGELVGFIGVAKNNLEMLFIHNNFRSKGIGKQLLKYAVNMLNIEKVDVNEQNTQAVDFYKHMGFKVINRSELDDQGKEYPILHMSL